ncbi:hypothetical protein HPB48_017856 [Haemaphysalis longicornis]|uniref:SWIM-type domain-containing protein n=1 Tax=Haemaphysalis longicornis TaxID=44386 RepID=A0A9J6FZP7_HAELO|nr:hypothetical protein HPB48_017856 [Haemaphysalis longicornis]
MSTAGADSDVDDDEMPGPSHMTTSQPNTREVLVTETLVSTHPDNIREWSDDMRDWPDMRGPDTTYYLLRTKACDLKDVACYKSLPSFNYLQSGWVGKVMVHKVRDGIVILNTEVGPPQGVNKPNHHAWVSAEMCGRVLRAGCTCMAGEARACSHVGAILWKVDCAVTLGLTGRACTDVVAEWNRGTKRNVQPCKIEGMSFHLQPATVDPELQRQPATTNALLSEEEISNMHQDSGYPELFKIPGTIFCKSDSRLGNTSSVSRTEDREKAVRVSSYPMDASDDHLKCALGAYGQVSEVRRENDEAVPGLATGVDTSG